YLSDDYIFKHVLHHQGVEGCTPCHDAHEHEGDRVTRRIFAAVLAHQAPQHPESVRVFDDHAGNQPPARRQAVSMLLMAPPINSSTRITLTSRAELDQVRRGLHVDAT